MTGPFVYELASVHAAIERAHPADPKGIYAVPFYLVIGEPGAGRSTAVRLMNLTWPPGDGPLQIGVPQQQCTYWLANEALFIEPEAQVLGPNRSPDQLTALCEELRRVRAREPVDGILLIINVAEIIDLDEGALDAYANRLRLYLTDVSRALHADVPTYVVIARYDTLWGFAEVFQWTADRRREDPWGFTLPYDTDSQRTLPAIREALEGLNARLESFCLYKLASEDPPEQRVRAFQHLAEVRALKEKLYNLFNVLAMANAFERAPWFRAAALGSALPGTGDRLRAGVTRFMNMGLAQPQPNATGMRPGGLPIHALMKTVVLPERDLVPLRTRWRDDPFIIYGSLIGVLMLLATGMTQLILFFVPL